MELANLVSDLILAKTVEENAKKSRIEIEEEIAALVPGPDRGQNTVAVEGFKVTVERGYNYKADLDTIRKDWPSNPSYAPPIKSKTTHELDEKGYEWIKNNDLDTFKYLSQHVTVTPKKVAVSIKQAKK